MKSPGRLAGFPPTIGCGVVTGVPLSRKQTQCYLAVQTETTSRQLLRGSQSLQHTLWVVHAGFRDIRVCSRADEWLQTAYFWILSRVAFTMITGGYTYTNTVMEHTRHRDCNSTRCMHTHTHTHTTHTHIPHRHTHIHTHTHPHTHTHTNTHHHQTPAWSWTVDATKTHSC